MARKPPPAFPSDANSSLDLTKAQKNWTKSDRLGTGRGSPYHRVINSFLLRDLHKSPQSGLAAAALSSHRLSAQTARKTAERRGDLIKVSQCVRDCPGAREVIQNADGVPLHHRTVTPQPPKQTPVKTLWRHFNMYILKPLMQNGPVFAYDLHIWKHFGLSFWNEI